MKAQEFENLIPDYILGKLTKEQDGAFSQYLKEHPNALEDWNTINKRFSEAGSEPSEQMDTTFYTFLEKEKQHNISSKNEGVKSLSSYNGKSKSNMFRFLIAACILLLFGFFVGKQWQTNTNVVKDAYVNTDFEASKKETETIRTQLVMSLADQSSASKRLQALSEASKLDNATEQVIIALFKMLNTDTNVNVRLAAVTSLSKYVDNPKVREGLILSITKQESPLVQIALAELMVTLKEQKSINSMEALLQKPNINSAVKQKLEESIKQII